jgi:GR25 family glycosyltransferase involved in LPS biosynthesis
MCENLERTKKCQEHFRERGVVSDFLHYGFNAQQFGIQTEFPYELDAPGSGFRMGYKGTGTWLSHYMVWNIMEMLPDKHVFILEDDAKFPDNWLPKFNRAFQDVPPDFDMLYVGSCCCKDKPTTHIKGDIYLVQWPMCLHAYIVAKKAVPMLLSTQRKIYAPIDISLALHTLPKLKTYCVLPRLAEQWDTVIEP